MSEKLKPCPFCGGPATDLDEVTTKEDRIEGDPIIACLSPDCPQVTSRLMFWNNRPGEATARLTALEEGEQSTIAFIQSHFYDRPDEIECLEKDIADAFQILTEKP